MKKSNKQIGYKTIRRRTDVWSEAAKYYYGAQPGAFSDGAAGVLEHS